MRRTVPTRTVATGFECRVHPIRTSPKLASTSDAPSPINLLLELLQRRKTGPAGVGSSTSSRSVSFQVLAICDFAHWAVQIIVEMQQLSSCRIWQPVTAPISGTLMSSLVVCAHLIESATHQPGGKTHVGRRPEDRSLLALPLSALQIGRARPTKR